MCSEQNGILVYAKNMQIRSGVMKMWPVKHRGLGFLGNRVRVT